MNLLISDYKKKQIMSTGKNVKLRIFSKCMILVAISMIGYMLLITLVNAAAGQMPYITSKMALVSMGENGTASVFCKDGDGMISGGYSTDFSAPLSAFDTMVYSNHPTQDINQSGYFEGWEVGLVNKGNTTAKITATVLCLNLTLTP